MMAMQQMSHAFPSSSKSSSSSVVSSKKHDVFLSFRGEDTRRNFTSHLYEALSRKKVETFKDDNELQKGDEISPALVKAIEESHASIVIFSENYASSKWCLDELNKILECKKDRGQIVIPVFYNIDPSHVRKHNIGSYMEAFAKHERDTKLNKDKLHKWKASLTEAANLAGWDSQNYRIESGLIKDIVEDVLQKLNRRYTFEVKGLVGIEENYEKAESLLKIGSNDVRILGIWGMGGIGKTTLATTLYANLYSQFEGHCFLANVREESNKRGVNFLRNKLFSALLGEENLRVEPPYVEIPFSIIRLARKKVFIVLDDVATQEQIEDMIDNNWLGPGSRVIITARDKHIFSQFDECEIYKVKELNTHESLQLFCLTVFREKYPKIGYEDLSTSVIAHCKGNPLALKVLGANLRSRSKEAWKSELKKLQYIPNGKIHNLLKLSYDDLDRTQKGIFLDIACFLKGRSRGRITSLLEACGFFAAIGIEVLLDKALIQLDQRDLMYIEMHDLIQEMGREIVNQESNDPGKRSRLWKPEEVYDVLKNNKGTEVVEGIRLDITEIRDLYLSSDSFKRMTNLRFLDIYSKPSVSGCNVYFSDGLGWLSDKLRYLRWNYYCLESLPPTFCAEMLVELHMPSSKLKKLWDGVQNLVNLETIDLNNSEDLIDVPDLSMALNLERVNLSYCESLRQLHPSVLSLPKLTSLDLLGCKKIESLKTNILSKSLRELYLSDCSSLTEFSVTSEEMTTLHLHGTAMRELSMALNLEVVDLSYCESLRQLHPSVFSLPKLTYLDLEGCKKIESLKTNVHSKSLEEVNLKNCSSLTEFSVTSEKMTLLDLRGTAIRELSSSIWRNSKLRFLYLRECYKLDIVGKKLSNGPGLGSLSELSLYRCTQINASNLWFILDGIQSLESLDLSYCFNLKTCV